MFAALFASVLLAVVVVDDKIPAGNVIVRGIDKDKVNLEIDYRTSTNGWFYWAYRVRGAEGGKLSFAFSRKYWTAVGSRGAAFSRDRGETWEWTDVVDPKVVKEKGTGDHKDQFGFDFAFGPDDREVWFSQTMPYGEREWNRFLSEFAAVEGKSFERQVLCKSKKGRDVELVRFGRLDGKARYRMFVSSRHHCQEASATFVVEGMMRAVLADDALGRWFRENVELRVVPFVDKDGVVEGDQGKGRQPWDHGRDYNDDRPQVHPEVAAIMKMLRAWRPTVVQDTHSPWLRGDWREDGNTNEYAYMPGGRFNGTTIEELGKILERISASGFGYRESDNLPFGKSWNKPSNYKQGHSLGGWVQGELKCGAKTVTFEIPFANQREKTLYPKDFKEFGREIAAAWREYLPTVVQ